MYILNPFNDIKIYIHVHFQVEFFFWENHSFMEMEQSKLMHPTNSLSNFYCMDTKQVL